MRPPHAYFPWMYPRLVKAEQGEATAGRLCKEVDAEACGTACWKVARGRRGGTGARQKHWAECEEARDGGSCDRTLRWRCGGGSRQNTAEPEH